MPQIYVIISPGLQTDTYIDELVEIFLKLSMKTVQVHLIIWTTLNVETNGMYCNWWDSYKQIIIGFMQCQHSSVQLVLKS